MHIEPHVVTGAKLLLSYATAAGSLGFITKLAWDTTRSTKAFSTAVKSLFCTFIGLVLFQLLPHPSMGVSEVHLILGSTLFLFFGVAPAAIGLAASLLIQGLVWAQFDLPQYGMNVTTLIVPMIMMHLLAKKIIAPNTQYADISFKQALKLSVTFQTGIVSWVAFWTFYGQGVSAETMTNVATFALAYAPIMLIEPVIDLAALYTAKSLLKNQHSSLLNQRLFS